MTLDSCVFRRNRYILKTFKKNLSHLESLFKRCEYGIWHLNPSKSTLCKRDKSPIKALLFLQKASNLTLIKLSLSLNTLCQRIVKLCANVWVLVAITGVLYVTMLGTHVPCKSLSHRDRISVGR